MAYDGDGAGGGQWTNAQDTLLSDQWVRITVAQDFTNQSWALSVNGTEKLTGLGFKDNSVTRFSTVSIRDGIGGAVRCDDIEVASD